MKPADWNDCEEQHICIRASPDPGKARSLLDTCAGRLAFIEDHEITEANVNFLFELTYSSLIETAHAILIIDGFKVDNHICIGFYFRDVIAQEDLHRVFDDARVKRNGLVYYGRRMDYDTALRTMNSTQSLLKKLKGIAHERLAQLKKK